MTIRYHHYHTRSLGLVRAFLTITVSQTAAPPGRAMDIIVGGDAQELVADKHDPESLVDEEGGNQWLYSCVACGDGGDVVMCDTVRLPRVFHVTVGD